MIVTLHTRLLLRLGRSLTSARGLSGPRANAAAQATEDTILDRSIPSARVVWHYRYIADGLALVLPTADLSRLAHLQGIAKIWPNVVYQPLSVTRTTVTRAEAVNQGPQVIGADKLWGPNLQTAGQGIKIGIIDDGIDARHVYFNPAGFHYPKGFPKGIKKDTTPKVIVQRTFAPATPAWIYKNDPFDPSPNGSFHATHVAGIAAGDHNTLDGDLYLSGIAPLAYLGNYKALTIPTPGFGLDGNSVSIAAAIDAAVGDGMNIINLSLGEPEIAPSRDFVVLAIDAAARHGVVPVIAADNQFDQYGFGSISSPANSPDAITVAATTLEDTIADFSSGGPTPVSKILKPDVSAPGVEITSSLPVNQAGPFGAMSGTSMAAPQVSGAVALLMQRHPTWTVEEIKSALVLTGDPVHTAAGGGEVSVLREGGGLIDLVRADDPLIFSDPATLSFPVNGGTIPLDLTDAGGGSGTWTVTTDLQKSSPHVPISVASSVTVPGLLDVTATVDHGARNGDYTGFIVLTHGVNTRRIPFWVEVDHPLLGTEPAQTLTHPGIYTGNTIGGPRKVSRYQYPTRGDVSYPGPERAYLVHITRPVANFGVAVLSGHAVPHVVFAGDENHLVGFTGLPTNLNPYLDSFGETRPVAGDVLPAPGTYEIVFDTRSTRDAGPFTFRYWVNDTTPPTVRVLSAANHAITLSLADTGAGVDPESIDVTLDGHDVIDRYNNGILTVQATAGRHLLIVTVSDYQELKNMEDVGPIKPNTTTFRRSIVVRR